MPVRSQTIFKSGYKLMIFVNDVVEIPSLILLTVPLDNPVFSSNLVCPIFFSSKKSKTRVLNSVIVY